MSAAGDCCYGATAGGTITELIAVGAADKYLTSDPTITFWRFRYSKYTNFAMESIEQPFTSTVAFGSDVQVTLNRTGDLVFYQYVVIDLPGIRAVSGGDSTCGVSSTNFPCFSNDNSPMGACDPCGDESPEDRGCCNSNSAQESPVDDFLGSEDLCTGLAGPWAHYTNAIGQFLIRRACLVIGGQVIDTLYNDFMFMWEELAGKVGARLTEMIGKRYTRVQLIADSFYDRRLWVPLPFSYTQTSGNALPLVSLQFHGVQISVCFEQLQRCVIQSDCSALVLKTRDCTPLVAQDLSARLESTYIYLDIQERDRFAVGAFEQLVTQVQMYVTNTRIDTVRLQLNFNHPVIELIWAVRRKCQEAKNNHFNYAGKWNLDPVNHVSLRFNNLPRFSGKSGKYFRLVQPYQHHSLKPDAYIYCYSFALNPEDAQPSGSVNMSRIDNCELLLDLQPELFDSDGEVTVMVFGRNWNIFRYRQGLGGLAYTN